MKTICSILFLFASSFCFAQKKPVPGYVVLNNGDTLQGEIEKIRDDENPGYVNFISNGSLRRYFVGDLRSFSLKEGSFYHRFIVSYQLGAANFAAAREVFDTATETKDVFLRLLFKAEYSLYEYKTPQRKYFFVFSEKDGLRELVYRVRKNSSGGLEKDEQYKNLLQTYAISSGNEAVFQKKISLANYERDDLLRLFGILNGGKKIFSESAEIRIRIDVAAGASYTFFKSSGTFNVLPAYALDVGGADFKSTLGFNAGFGLWFSDSRKNGRLSSRIGVNLASFTLDGLNTDGSGSFDREEYKGTLVVAEPNLSFDFLLKRTDKNAWYAGIFGGANLIIANGFSFDGSGPSLQLENVPPINGFSGNYGLSGHLLGGWGNLNMRIFKTGSFFDSPTIKLRGTGIILAYSYFIKK